jgi:hypothetical protein
MGIRPTPIHIASTAKTFDIVHDLFGYPNSQVVAATAPKYGFITKYALNVCFNCSISNAN